MELLCVLTSNKPVSDGEKKRKSSGQRWENANAWRNCQALVNADAWFKGRKAGEREEAEAELYIITIYF